MSKSLTQAKTDFISYYSKMLPRLDIELFLKRKNSPVLLYSPFHEMELRSMFVKSKLSWITLDWFPYALERPPEVSISESLPGFAEGWLYSLNPASLLPVLSLNPKSDDFILDASAAPGGKTLAILNFTYPEIPRVVANDISTERFKRLKNTLERFGYGEVRVLRSSIEDLSEVVKEKFDKILLDAPCSGEKHVFNSKRFLKMWSPKQSEKLVEIQKSLILSLMPLLKPKGVLVYSTCSISKDENENQVLGVLKSHPELKLESPMKRVNEMNSSFDPMFVAVIKKYS